MFLELRSKERILVSPMPGYSTHGEIKMVEPFQRLEQNIECFFMNIVQIGANEGRDHVF